MSRTLISIFSGLGGMFGWGVSDFFANSASEKIGHAKTFFWSQIAGLATISLFAFFSSVSFTFTPTLLGLSVLAGIAYTFGYLFFYKGFEMGNVSVVSATANIQILFVIAVSYFLFRQNLTSYQIPAILLLLVGVTLVSVNFSDFQKGTVSLLGGVKEALTAALFFGIFYWPLNEFIAERADWLAAAFIIKLTAIATVYCISLFNKQKLNIQQQSNKFFVLIAFVGILEALAVLSLTYGQAYGDGIIATPIGSSSVVVTTVLAYFFSKEKISKLQALGIALVVSGITMINF